MVTLCSPIHAAGDELRRCPSHTRLHRVLPRTALLAQASDAMLATSAWCWTLPLVRPFACGSALNHPTDYYGLCWLLAPARHRCPFRHKARSPQVRTHSFTARPPDLRRFPLITRASRFLARSPWSATPSIRFLFIGPQLRSTLPSHTRSPSCSCASLRSLWSTHDGTCTH